MKLEGKFKGQLKLISIEVKEVLSRKVSLNNESSGKVTVPRDFVGEEILIVIPKK
ncbi:MAG: DUF2080 family transposase-associated protein [Nanoarchaeota archaeon]|nr:DUF2080 family transposase-associated protein [Nanoarchaeota archaeon]